MNDRVMNVEAVLFCIKDGSNTLLSLKRALPHLSESAIKRRLHKLSKDGKIKWSMKPHWSGNVVLRGKMWEVTS